MVYLHVIVYHLAYCFRSLQQYTSILPLLLSSILSVYRYKHYTIALLFLLQMVNYLLKRFLELRKNILYFISFKQIYFTFGHIYTFLIGGFPGGSGVKNLPVEQEIQEMRV